ASLQAQLDIQRQAYAKRPRKYTLSAASTQKARDALYLDGWRKKIEAVGNLNYPEQASRDGIYGNLRLLVALRPDGSISDVRILSSSGYKVLDEAALRIVHLAAPFEAFPDSMKREVDILEIIRTWQFQQGNSFSSN
ncbi:MAG: energy transducer TonB, partial [Pseudomonadales bacterium]|nr:energy transducer TonB [Pseudomonadales bacterium]